MPFIWGAVIVLVCLTVYVLINPNRSNFYVHFVWQAQSWLDGQTSIPIGVKGSAQSPGDDWYQDVQPILDADGQSTGRGIIPFPPLPAVVLLPFVAVWHLWTNEYLLAGIFSAVDVALAYWMLGFLPLRPEIRRLVTVFFGLGTVLLYAAAIGSTWFWAHVVALGCLLPALGLALSADRAAAEPESVGAGLRASLRPGWPGARASVICLAVLAVGLALLFGLARPGTSAAVVAGIGLVLCLAAAALALAVSRRGETLSPSPAITLFGERIRQVLSLPETRQVAAGILFGLACMARLTIVFGFPFLILVGGGGSWLRRGLLAGAGASIPLVLLLVYTFASTGHLFNPAYDYLYHQELGYTFLNYHADWSIEDLRYVPQNFQIMFFRMPVFLPQADAYGHAYCVAGEARSLLNTSCPIVAADPVGTSLILSSPAYLLAPLAWLAVRARKLDRVTLGATIAVLAIGFVNLMHFSQGWVQFGYRFSNDFAPFALLLVALGASRIRVLWPVVALVGLSVAFNVWGAMWGVANGW